jgi:hypothetical protein
LEVAQDITFQRSRFQRMRSERSNEPLDVKVFRVGECQKALDRACKKVGTDRLALVFCLQIVESLTLGVTQAREFFFGGKLSGAIADLRHLHRKGAYR